MAAYYLDTSALVKRYAREQGSSWIGTLMDPAQGHDLYTVRPVTIQSDLGVHHGHMARRDGDHAGLPRRSGVSRSMADRAQG